MTKVPDVFLGEPLGRSENVPDLAGGCAKRRLLANTRKQWCGLESYGRSAEGHACRSKTRRSLHQNTLHRNESNMTLLAINWPILKPINTKVNEAVHTDIQKCNATLGGQQSKSLSLLSHHQWWNTTFTGRVDAAVANPARSTAHSPAHAAARDPRANASRSRASASGPL